MTRPVPPSPLLSKTKFCAGLQCLKRLYWTVREPDAPELVPDAVTQHRFDVGHVVGREACTRFPGGVLIAESHREKERAVSRTAAAVASGVPALFEGAFQQEAVHVRADILERAPGGMWNLVEVKSSTKLKKAHIPDLAVQWRTITAAGLVLQRAELMHLNRSCRHPDLEDLFTREDCTDAVRDFLPRVDPELQRQRTVLEDGEPPPVPPGVHCHEPYACPFLRRCWEETPADHVAELYGLSLRRRLQVEASGSSMIGDLPPGFPLTEIQRRQVQAVRSARPVVTRALVRKLAEPLFPVYYLDFESTAPAIPRHRGASPYTQIPFQFSIHRLSPDLHLEHFDHLDESDDPRPALARRLLEILGKEGSIVTYAPFERSVIRHLAATLQEYRSGLESLLPRLWDLHRVIQTGIYHPAFRGSLGLKSVYPALCPGRGYGELAIASGQEAAVLYEELMHTPAEDRKREIREVLRAYCALDTEAMVEIHRALQAFPDSAVQGPPPEKSLL